MTRQLPDAPPKARSSVLATARDFLLRNSAERAGSVWFAGNLEVMAKVLKKRGYRPVPGAANCPQGSRAV